MGQRAPAAQCMRDRCGIRARARTPPLSRTRADGRFRSSNSSSSRVWSKMPVVTDCGPQCSARLSQRGCGAVAGVLLVRGGMLIGLRVITGLEPPGNSSRAAEADGCICEGRYRLRTPHQNAEGLCAVHAAEPDQRLTNANLRAGYGRAFVHCTVCVNFGIVLS